MNVNDGGNSSRSETTDNGSTSDSPRGRFRYHRLRRASFISPITGERSKRTFTLQEASHRWSESSNANSSETTPLLRSQQRPSASALLYFQELWKHAWEFANSKTGRGIFKCTLAYFLGTLVTFVPALSGLIGRQQDSKHIVATVTVWFHPARTIGSMHLVRFKSLNPTQWCNLLPPANMSGGHDTSHTRLPILERNWFRQYGCVAGCPASGSACHRASSSLTSFPWWR